MAKCTGTERQAKNELTVNVVNLSLSTLTLEGIEENVLFRADSDFLARQLGIQTFTFKTFRKTRQL